MYNNHYLTTSGFNIFTRNRPLSRLVPPRPASSLTLGGGSSASSSSRPSSPIKWGGPLQHTSPPRPSSPYKEEYLGT